MSATIPQVAQAMQTVLTSKADAAAKDTKFVQRESKLTGAIFTQTLVFSWLAKPQSSLEELTQTAAALGIRISPQGLDQRFTKEAAQCLYQVLSAAVASVLTAEPVVVPLLQRFNGVYLHDSSVIVLPDALAAAWEGCGGNTAGTAAALKLQVRLDLNTGGLTGPLLQDGRAQDRTTPLQTAPLPAGALRLADLGYFDLAVLAAFAAAGVHWLSRWRAGTAFYDETGQPLDLAQWLQTRADTEVVVERAIYWGAAQRLPGRVVAARLPPAVAAERRRKLRAEARKKGQTPSKARLALADWTILVTNIPLALATARETLLLARVRWQIEILFKVWKSCGQIDEWRSEKPWRILCEVYAKLLAMVIQHWLFLVSNWVYPDRSLLKAAQTVQKHALHLASVFNRLEELEKAITVIQRCLSFGCRINKSRNQPHTYQDLLAAGGLA